MGEKVRITFFLSKEVVDRLDKVYARLLLSGKKVKKSHIVEEALEEKIEELERELS